MTTGWEIETERTGAVVLWVYYCPVACNWTECIERALRESDLDRKSVLIIATPEKSPTETENPERKRLCFDFD